MSPTVKRAPLAEYWQLYLREIVPEGAGFEQQTECRRAFYAGAQALLSCMTGQLEDGPDATDAEVAYVESLNQELKQFAADVAGGRA